MSLTLIDPKAGTHFVGKIFVTPHALVRATEHFGVERSAAPAFVMDMLRKSALIDDNFTGEDGKTGRLFVHKRTALIVAQDESTVITLYPQEFTAQELITTPVAKIVKRIIRAAQREESAELKRLQRLQAEINVAIAEAELAKTYTNSAARIRKLDEEIAEHNSEIKRIIDEIYTVKRAKATVLKGVCAYV